MAPGVDCRGTASQVRQAKRIQRRGGTTTGLDPSADLAGPRNDTDLFAADLEPIKREQPPESRVLACRRLPFGASRGMLSAPNNVAELLLSCAVVPPLHQLIDDDTQTFDFFLRCRASEVHAAAHIDRLFHPPCQYLGHSSRIVYAGARGRQRCADHTPIVCRLLEGQ